MFVDNAPHQTGFNTEMQIVKRLVIMDIFATNPHSPWQNKSESVIKIIKGESKRRRVQINIYKRVWDI